MDLFKALNETGMPKVFWWVVSIAIVVLVVGVLWWLHNTSQVNIKTATLQLTLNQRQLDTHAAELQQQATEVAQAQDEVLAVATTPTVAATGPAKVKVDKLRASRERVDLIQSGLKAVRTNLQEPMEPK